MYTTDGGEVAELLQKELEEYLVKYKVDLALWGHVHNYQRTCPGIQISLHVLSFEI
jgi:predicted phosphohydrolase